MTQLVSSSAKYASSSSESTLWYDVTHILEQIFHYGDAKTVFRSRAVRRQWQRVLHNIDEPGVWGRFIAASFPSFQMTWKHLQLAHSAYNDLRIFSIADLRTTAEIPHLLITDCAAIPLAWVTNVPMTTKCYDLYEIASLFLPEGAVDSPDLLAVGIVLEKTKRLMELCWPSRKGKMGWRLDLLVTVRGLIWNWDENLDTAAVLLERKKSQHDSVRPVSFAVALQEAKREKERREIKRIEAEAATKAEELDGIDLDL